MEIEYIRSFLKQQYRLPDDCINYIKKWLRILLRDQNGGCISESFCSPYSVTFDNGMIKDAPSYILWNACILSHEEYRSLHHFINNVIIHKPLNYEMMIYKKGDITLNISLHKQCYGQLIYLVAINELIPPRVLRKKIKYGNRISKYFNEFTYFRNNIEVTLFIYYSMYKPRGGQHYTFTHKFIHNRIINQLDRWANLALTTDCTNGYDSHDDDDPFTRIDKRDISTEYPDTQLHILTASNKDIKRNKITQIILEIKPRNALFFKIHDIATL
jgi:hypothetical protein